MLCSIFYCYFSSSKSYTVILRGLIIAQGEELSDYSGDNFFFYVPYDYKSYLILLVCEQFNALLSRAYDLPPFFKEVTLIFEIGAGP